jgi:AcrR family transcriptional regulator
MPSTGEERRARRGEERRQGILKAAASVFARKGFERATTREIAQAAEVAEGTIYNYFASKEELLAALVDAVRDEFAAVLAEGQLEGDHRDHLVRAVERALQVIADNAESIRGLVAALWDQSRGFEGYLIPGSRLLMVAVQAHLQTGMQEGTLRPLDSEAVAHMILGMVTFLALPYVRGVEAVPSAQQRHVQAELLATVLLDGLKLREGQA